MKKLLDSMGKNSTAFQAMSVYCFPDGSANKDSASNSAVTGDMGLLPGSVGKIPWRRTWQATSVFLPGKAHGWRSLAGYSPWGHKEPDMTEAPEHACTLCVYWVLLAEFCSLKVHLLKS